VQNWPNKIALLTTDETDTELFECMLAEDYETVFTSTLDETKDLGAKVATLHNHYLRREHRKYRIKCHHPN